MFSQISRLPVALAALLVSSVSLAGLQPYSEDFESLDAEDGSALDLAGFKVFANVFAPDGVTFLYGYGAFPAPNGTGAFSNVAVAQGGPAQGAQQIVTFSDYLNGDHNIGNRIQTSVFQEQIIDGGDVGQTWTFRFDAKLGDLAGASTAQAFIKTLDPGAGFATTNFITQETTAIPATWNTYELSLEIIPALVGQILQIGFETVASNFESSGVVYDNLNFSPPLDSDDDGILDNVDNCTDVPNAGQQDADGDGHGNICDADFNQSCGIVNFPDLAIMQAGFFTLDSVLDLNSSGGPVNFADLSIMQGLFFAPPGPSAPGALCN